MIIEKNTIPTTPSLNKNLSKKARRMMIKELGVAALAGKDIDHIKPLSKGGSNARSNLRVMSVAKNRGRK